MTEPRMRAAVPEDVRKIEALIRDAYGKYVERLGKPPAPMTADYGHLVDVGDVWVLELDGTVVGMMVLKSAMDHFEVGNVAVSTTHRRRGFGSRLLAHAEEQARQRGLPEIRLFTNELMHENLVLYRKLGWMEYDRAE
ncbi:GNAT family N-acetyltransferase [Methylocella tundrae]|uniref:N-acetyltransferase domain-containing protein n=1 Tax=Methylocella tundrae TaxID=227605 RepID=A0A4U8YZE5_METTU|nr:GNAT family N-acetyltransferase [Methylocella tundrae]WPP05921.1 GNAT family N-acetyltransferase [Methylocella tundrae]VFU08467.1 conserved protein of unknown function [Methylocella tundrae]